MFTVLEAGHWPVDDLALSDHEEAAVADVGGVEFEISVGQHHQAGGAWPDDLLLVLLHFAETLIMKKYY